jgi:DeoR/GlpR family transcriptional regulator of sugar metabolism
VIIEQLSRKTYSTLRDVAEILPGVSERTLRYDIQRMVDKKIVERVGGGGPHSFLRLKKGKTAGTAGASGSDK